MQQTIGCIICRLFLRLLQVTIQNERRGTGGLIDFFLGEPGSRILLDNVYRLRPACTASADTAVVGESEVRHKRMAYPLPQQQIGCQKSLVGDLQAAGVVVQCRVLVDRQSLVKGHVLCTAAALVAHSGAATCPSIPAKHSPLWLLSSVTFALLCSTIH